MNDNRQWPAWLVLPGCCCSLFGLAALIWLIILQVQVNKDETKLLRLTSCAPLAPCFNGALAGRGGGGTGDGVGVATAAAHGKAVHAREHKHSGLVVGQQGSQSIKKKSHEAKASQLLQQQQLQRSQHDANLVNDEELLPADAAPPRWTRVGSAKKPGVDGVKVQ